MIRVHIRCACDFRISLSGGVYWQVLKTITPQRCKGVNFRVSDKALSLVGSQNRLSSKDDAAERVLLNHVSTWAKHGEITSIVGPSGSGKTTLLDAIAGRIVTSSLEVKRGPFTVIVDW